jgi:hypothetical protein
MANVIPSASSSRLLIGYWHESPDEETVLLPHPQPLVAPEWNTSLRAEIVKYLNNGALYRASRGFSYCRFGCTQKRLQRPADYDPYAAVTADVSGVIVLGVDESELEEVEGEMSNGSTDLCDDVWCWPEGLAHYVEVHHVRLPDEFVAHAVSRHFEPAPRPSRGTELDYSFWLTWAQLNAPFRFEPHCHACRESREHRRGSRHGLPRDDA